jgi:RNA polymerase sigma-70 factor (ECF subfamily)
VVLAAGGNEETKAASALEALCKSYWHPLYAYLRKRGFSPHDAQDLTQGFFTRLLEGGWVTKADATKGRFRTFLLTALNRFLANEWDRERAQKRGGGQKICPIDTEVAERLCTPTQAGTLPDAVYDRQWALTLLERALSRIREEQESAGKKDEFAILVPYLSSERGEIPYEELAVALGTSEATARQAVHRLRKRFRQAFRDEIANTVDDPGQIEDEIRHLLSALSA